MNAKTKKEPEFKPIRLPLNICDRAMKIIKDYDLQYSLNSIAVKSISEMLDMIESNPNERKLPEICVMIDAIKQNRKGSISFEQTKKVSSQRLPSRGDTGAGVALGQAALERGLK